MKITAQIPIAAQKPQVTPTLPCGVKKPRKSLTLGEAAYLGECSQDKILLWGDLGEFEINQAPSGRRYVDYPSFMKFLGEPVQPKVSQKW